MVIFSLVGALLITTQPGKQNGESGRVGLDRGTCDNTTHTYHHIITTISSHYSHQQHPTYNNKPTLAPRSTCCADNLSSTKTFVGGRNRTGIFTGLTCLHHNEIS
ncbi:hypothetical protein CROQUDRAFT_371866 [Cronartium quercuum f. sp. fusiforme G11]|uniref:Secreted protein n=1 Tax=Cronartium quercuum f. sp. fusiforme G11 TaxID=708437 RepID=A0A9P6NRC8_9BASI|nr:hypothetical protein CROQUDRAFT_371866 [Cronartium quercuum f. sp. fusiforme G11]